MYRKLNSEERVNLIKSHRKERNGKIPDRIKAVLLFDKDYSYQKIAEILLLDDETIRRHIKDYFQKNKLAPESGGSESYLSAAETKALIKHLNDETYLYVKEICSYVKKAYGISYSISGMTKWLYANGFRYKKPHAVPAKADKQKQQEFVNQYEELKKTAKDEPIYFGDSVHPQHQTHLAYGWIPKGKRKEVPMTGRQYRLNFIGGICLNGHKVVYEQTDKVNTDSLKLFLLKLRKKHPEGKKIHLILDNAGYHKGKEIQEFAAVNLIELHYLPPYSPNLNPIERLWKIMHEQVSYNKYYEKFAEFTDATLEFFRNVGRRKKILRSRITDNFQILDSPLFAS